VENDSISWEKTSADLYSKCQYVSLHIPLNKETRESVNYDLMKTMPEGATIVNTARKEVIHEPSMLKMFEQRPDFRYATDIEPDCKDQLAKYKVRYFATPKKMGAQTAEANMNAGVAAAKQIINFLEKGDITFQVNK
jgi:D-3-phosphoglycerate dehydrogenase